MHGIYQLFLCIKRFPRCMYQLRNETKILSINKLKKLHCVIFLDLLPYKNKQSQTLTKITFVSQILLCIFQLHRDILSVIRHRVFDYLCVKTNTDGYIYYDIYVEEVNPYNQIASIKCNIFTILQKLDVILKHKPAKVSLNLLGM